MPSILRVNVIAAKDLTAKDWTTSDPFVIIKLGGQSHKTSVIFRNLSPVWNFSCDFIITPALVDARIQLECWDKDLIGRDFLGRLSIPAYEAVFNAFDDPRNTPSWHMLSARSPKEKISGELKLKFGYVGDLGHDIKQLEAFAANLRKQHLQATLVSSEDPADELYSPSEAISSLSGRSPINANTNLSLESIDIENSVDSISNITNLVEGSSLDHTALRGMLSLEIQSGCIAASFDNSNVDPFVVITFGQKTFKTRILRKTVNPVWNERAVIHVKHVDLETNHPISLGNSRL
ncbi:C2 domain-containing protein [Chytridium lagenaria]|nr:C2 domain-containing protein [Chytridium lagenaria]